MADQSLEGIVSKSIKEYITPKETIYKCKILKTYYDQTAWMLSEASDSEKFRFIESSEKVKYLCYDETLECPSTQCYQEFKINNLKEGKFCSFMLDCYKKDGNVLCDGWDYTNSQYFIYSMERIC